MLDKNKLGKRIKKVREERHLTLKNIEAAAGISATHISEIERGKTSPTLGALIRIAKALEKEAAYFMEDEDLRDISLVTAESRIRESVGHDAGTIERLTASIPGGRLQGCVVRLNPGKMYHVAPHSHHGSEAAIVLSGKFVFDVAGTRYLVEEGDSILYNALEPHSYANAALDDVAVMLWVCTERGVT